MKIAELASPLAPILTAGADKRTHRPLTCAFLRPDSSAYGIRTRVCALRGHYPGPLDECATIVIPSCPAKEKCTLERQECQTYSPARVCFTIVVPAGTRTNGESALWLIAGTLPPFVLMPLPRRCRVYPVRVDWRRFSHGCQAGKGFFSNREGSKVVSLVKTAQAQTSILRAQATSASFLALLRARRER